MLAVLSVLFPFATLAGTLAYQSFANADFWRRLTPDESVAGAMMGFGEFA